MSLHPLHEALDYPTDDNDFSHDSTSEFELERGLSVFDESTWHTSDDLAEIPIAGHNAYVKKKKYSARLREEEEVFGREVEWPAQGEETDASVDFEVFAPRLGSPDAEESEGSDKENSPDDGKVKRRLQRMQTEERAVAAGARGVKRRTLEDRDGGAESMQVSEKEGSSDEDVDADGDADSESEDSDSGKRGKKKASAGKAGKPKPAKKARTRGNKPASDDTKKRRSTTSSAPKGSVSNNFVSMKINKPRLGKYGKAMASRRGQGKFAKAISSVGSSYSTNFETNRSRTANRAVEDGFGGYGVLIEEADFAFDRPVGSAAVSVEPRVLGESRFLVDEDAPNAVAVSDVFFDAAADASPKEAFVDLDRALQECGVGPGFRDGQREALLHVLSGRSTLAVMPTGSGKSLLYQLPSYVLSRLQPSLTLVVTPTISLMEDQLRQLPTGLRGGVISSARDDVQATVDDLCAGLIDVLFVTPERLQSQAFLDLLGSGTCPPVKLACVDEAHCVSEWSHNFRPAFLHLDRALREVLKVPVILALTGTATAQARKDIAKLLQLEALVDTSTVRSNLRLTASKEEERDVAIFNLLRTAPWRDMNAVIVYCMRRVSWHGQNGLSTFSPTHRSLSPSRRTNAIRLLLIFEPATFKPIATTPDERPMNDASSKAAFSPVPSRFWSQRWPTAWASTSRISVASSTTACPKAWKIMCRRLAALGETERTRIATCF